MHISIINMHTNNICYHTGTPIGGPPSFQNWPQRKSKCNFLRDNLSLSAFGGIYLHGERFKDSWITKTIIYILCTSLFPPSQISLILVTCFLSLKPCLMVHYPEHFVFASTLLGSFFSLSAFIAGNFIPGHRIHSHYSKGSACAYDLQVYIYDFCN